MQSVCHRKVRTAHTKLKSYFIDAMPDLEIKSIQNSDCVAITNSIIDRSVGNLESIFRVRDSFYGVYYYPYSTEYHKPSKDFNCFINRMDIFRQSWLYQLVRNNLFERGYISFNMEISRMPSNRGITSSEAFEKQFQQYCSNFAQEHEKIKNLVPYKNFQDNGDITDVILDSKFSIILETYFDNNKVVTYSEKIFRCLQLPCPWVLFGPQHAVFHLRNMGFDLLDDLVDHASYDQIEFAVERQSKLLEIAKQLVDVDFSIHSKRIESAAQHNQKILKKFSKTWEADLDDVINLAVKKLNG